MTLVANLVKAGLSTTVNVLLLLVTFVLLVEINTLLIKHLDVFKSRGLVLDFFNSIFAPVLLVLGRLVTLPAIAAVSGSVVDFTNVVPCLGDQRFVFCLVGFVVVRPFLPHIFVLDDFFTESTEFSHVEFHPEMHVVSQTSADGLSNS